MSTKGWKATTGSYNSIYKYYIYKLMSEWGTGEQMGQAERQEGMELLLGR